MEKSIKIKSALISVYHKDKQTEEIIKLLSKQKITIYSTGGTFDYIKSIGHDAIAVEEITNYPSILGGRVKTLHPKVFGGILSRRENASDAEQIKKYEIPQIDLVIVDLYPFAQTVATTNEQASIIEKIDIGGISLIRAAAKNFNDVLIVPSSQYYSDLLHILAERDATTDINIRKHFAMKAFSISSHYDTNIYNYFASLTDEDENIFKISINKGQQLRYGENPHQKGYFYGNIEECIEKLNGKELSFNNLIDIDSAVNFIKEFTEPTFAVIKHTNICGTASRTSLKEAWKLALEADPVSAFGGILVTNRNIDIETATEVNKLFFEVVIAPSYSNEALELFKSKKNRIILQLKDIDLPTYQFKTVLNGIIRQDKDLIREDKSILKTVTLKSPTESEIDDLLFANIIVKHNKSNAIVLVKNRQLIGIGTGQTSRVDAAEQAIAKARRFNLELKDSVLASDAFFPFPDCVQLAADAGITAIVEPGGSVRDQESIDNCDKNNISMVFSGLRHFKH